MSSRFKSVEEAKIEERYDYAEQCRRHIERCLIAFSQDNTRPYDHELVKNAVYALEDLIPDDIRDERLDDDLKKAITKKMVVVSPTMAGLTMNREFCKRFNIIYEKELPVIDWHLYFRAIFNQLVRLKVVVRRTSRSG